jgi:RNA polymerase sigma factor, sigma-70 family
MLRLMVVTRYSLGIWGGKMLDKQSFVMLIDEKSEMLYRISRTILRNDEDCKDALQETALRAWANRGKLRDITLFSTWITRILINECHTLLRKKKKYHLQEEVAAPTNGSAPNIDLQWALEGLPDKLRLPLVLHYLEGYSYDEVADLLRIPKSAVRGRLSRARHELSLTLGKDKEAWLNEA